jgi:DNA-binding MarR family transcriptional regulator
MEINLGFLTNDISRLFRKRFDVASRQLGVTGAQWRALLVIARAPGISQGGLAEYLDVEPITTCRMVDRLEQAGMVERRPNPEDRRAWQLYLTASAAPTIDKLRLVGAEVIDQAKSGLSDTEWEQLIKLLVQVRDTLVQSAIDPTPLRQEA